MGFRRIALSAVIAAFAGTTAVAQGGDCDGCHLYLVHYYSNGFYMGHLAIPGVSTNFTPGLPGTGGGYCVGQGEDCDASSCAFHKGVVTVSNYSNPDKVFVRDVGSDEDRGVLEEGQSCGFPVASDTPGGQIIPCGSGVVDILTIVVGDNSYNVALLCTPCPGNAPY